MLNRLRKANNLRSIDWMGQKPGVDDLLFCAVELGGECGEAQDAIKKYSRFLQGVAGGVGPEQSKVDIAEELADTIISADRVASVMGIDLSAAIEDKFDKTSKKHNFKFMAEYLASYMLDPQIDYHAEFCQMEQEAQRLRELAESQAQVLDRIQEAVNEAGVYMVSECLAFSEIKQILLELKPSDRGGKGYEREVLGQNNEGDTVDNGVADYD